MKVRLYTRLGKTLFEGEMPRVSLTEADAEGFTVRELHRAFARGEICIEPADRPRDNPTPVSINLGVHERQPVGAGAGKRGD